jgi:cell division septation protein DedD
MTGGYAVQVAAQRSQADAQATLNALQTKYPQQLRGQHGMVRRADLGAKGIYYRALVGPFGSAEEASRLCSSLKAAGGNCIIQRI